MFALQPRAARLGGGADVGGRVCRCSPQAAGPSHPPAHEELLLVLERRGEGWGEEVLPHISLVRRPTKRRESKRLDVSGLHVLLATCGLPPDAVTDVVARATAWRATAGGRQLLDRRKHIQVQRHGERVVATLQAEAGVIPGRHLQTLLTQWPHLLELDCSKDWERQFCLLAARLHASRHGLQLPPATEEQAGWEEEQREKARLGALDASRLALLDGVCFDWGLADRDWEARFDELVAFALQAGHADVLDAHRSGVAADSPLGAWARRQVTLHSLGTLPPAVEARLRAIGLPLPQPPRAPPTAAPASEQPRPARQPRQPRQRQQAQGLAMGAA